MANYFFDIVCESTEAYIYFEGPRPTRSEFADYIIYEKVSADRYDSDSFELDTTTEVIWEKECYGLKPGTKYVVEISYDGTTYSDTFQTLNDKPSNFKWSISKMSGQPLRVSASEWNAFTKKINEFLKYKGKTTINFTSAVSAGLPQGAVVGGNHGLSEGKVISASIINEAVRALKSMGASVSEVASNQPITADFFNDIVTKLNSIT